MISVLPQWLWDLLASPGFAISALDEKIKNASDPTIEVWTTLGKAICLQKGGVGLPPDRTQAYQLYDNLLSQWTGLPSEVYQQAMLGKAICLQEGDVGDVGLQPDRTQAYQLYESLLQWPLQWPALLTEVYQQVILGKAICLQEGGVGLPPDRAQACQLYGLLLQWSTLALPSEIYQQAMLGKAICLQEGGVDLPANREEAYYLYQKLLALPNLLPHIREQAAINIAACLPTMVDLTQEVQSNIAAPTATATASPMQFNIVLREGMNTLNQSVKEKPKYQQKRKVDILEQQQIGQSKVITALSPQLEARVQALEQQIKTLEKTVGILVKENLELRKVVYELKRQQIEQVAETTLSPARWKHTSKQPTAVLAATKSKLREGWQHELKQKTKRMKSSSTRVTEISSSTCNGEQLTTPISEVSFTTAPSCTFFGNKRLDGQPTAVASLLISPEGIDLDTLSNLSSI